MFTGLISMVGRIEEIEPRGELKRARISCSAPPEDISVGASIACNGPCLTVAACGADAETWFEIDVGAETLARTTARNWRVGTKLNLERSLKIGDELGGHWVTGHVDGVAKIRGIDAFDGMKRFAIEAPPHLCRFIAVKGSVALDGTSLTVNDVKGDCFSILLIPHTLAVTTWDERQVGDELNIEVDLIARYAARLLELD
ncbi:MAG TPA: riboflavin synthase [Methylovirgula sp.]|nr:riboflavin synthase [Methylovirgula sp.]